MLLLPLRRVKACNSCQNFQKFNPSRIGEISSHLRYPKTTVLIRTVLTRLIQPTVVANFLCDYPPLFRAFATNAIVFDHYLGILWSAFPAFCLHKILESADFPAQVFAVVATGQ